MFPSWRGTAPPSRCPKRDRLLRNLFQGAAGASWRAGVFHVARAVTAAADQRNGLIRRRPEFDWKTDPLPPVPGLENTEVEMWPT